MLRLTVLQDNMTSLSRQNSIRFIILFGVVSLFADMTYEGARSITGQYLAVLGATGAVVGVVAGFGELIGYGFRLVSGYVSDRTGKYWLVTIVGFALNLFAVPLLALAGNWPLAATLIIVERLGKSIRTPSRDAMLSYAVSETGRGWGFGLHEAMDKTGAIVGPLIMSAVLYFTNSYQECFALLLIPAICAMSVLIFAKVLYPRPQDLETQTATIPPEGFNKRYWLYVAGVSCVAAGYVDFPLIAFHFKKTAHISDAWGPIFYSITMAATAISALVFGRLYDKYGLSVLIGGTFTSAFFVPLVFLDGFYSTLIGMILWGMGLGGQESIMRAFAADLVHKDKRGTGYGMLNIWFGISWFLGSALMGYLYDISMTSMIVFSLAIQWAAIPFFYAVRVPR